MSYQIDLTKRLAITDSELAALELAPRAPHPAPRTQWDTEVFAHYAEMAVGDGMVFNCMVGKIKSNLERTFTSHGLTSGLDYSLRATVVGADGLHLPGNARAFYVKRLSPRSPVFLT